MQHTRQRFFVAAASPKAPAMIIYAEIHFIGPIYKIPYDHLMILFIQ